MTKTTLFPASQRQTHEARSLPHRMKQRSHHDPVFYFDMTLAQDRIDVLSHAKFWKCFPTTRGQPILSSKWRRSTTPEGKLYSECYRKCCSYYMKTAFRPSSASWARSNSSRADEYTESRMSPCRSSRTRRNTRGTDALTLVWTTSSTSQITYGKHKTTERNDEKRRRRNSMRVMFWICEARAYILSMRTKTA